MLYRSQAKKLKKCLVWVNYLNNNCHYLIMIKKKYFTLEEAIEILPKVKILLGKLFKIQNKLKLHSQIQIDYDDEFLETAEVIRNELIESKYVYEFFKILHELIKIGVFVKNPDIGLVDFYSKFGDDSIFFLLVNPSPTP